jgi:hypothetical protein
LVCEKIVGSFVSEEEFKAESGWDKCAKLDGYDDLKDKDEKGGLVRLIVLKNNFVKKYFESSYTSAR